MDLQEIRAAKENSEALIARHIMSSLKDLEDRIGMPVLGLTISFMQHRESLQSSPKSSAILTDLSIDLGPV